VIAFITIAGSMFGVGRFFFNYIRDNILQVHKLRRENELLRQERDIAQAYHNGRMDEFKELTNERITRLENQ
jgi:hypothetical protein